MKWNLPEILSLTNARVVRWGHEGEITPVQDITQVGPGSLYFPMYRRAVGERLFETLSGSGTAGVVLYEDQDPPPAERHPGLGVLYLPSPVEGYLKIAAEARRRSRGLVVGITGSSGKSSVKEYLAAILAGKYVVHATVDSHNLITDCADLLLDLDDRLDEAVVAEMGFGWVGDIDRMAALARPLAGIITKVAPDHLDGAQGSIEVVAREKGKLGLHVPPHGFMVVNADDQGSRAIPRDAWRTRVLTFGQGSSVDAAYGDVQADESGTRFTLSLTGKPFQCRLRTYGSFQAANATAAAVAARALGFGPPAIVEALASVPPLPRRFAIYRFTRGLTIIDDTFSASVDAVTLGLQNAASLARKPHTVAVLSGIAQLVHWSGEYHRLIGKHAAEQGFEQIVLVILDDRTRAIRKGALEAGLPEERIHVIEQWTDICGALLRFVNPDTLIYCKASQLLWIGPQIDALRKAVEAEGYEALGAA
jgi:UDP-N-acetylmuramoyl-tripeptide--D-alanyl-D-alanine ligase